MITGSLETTNLLLGIMAAVSVMQALALIGAGIVGYRLYSTAMQTIRELEQRQVAPLVAKAQNILADVQDITTRVRQETERVDDALRGTMERVDETAEIVRSRMREKTDRAMSVLRRVRAVVESVLTRDAGTARQSSAAATGRV
jgi:hypothetical protein